VFVQQPGPYFTQVYVAAIDGVAGIAVEGGLTTRGTVLVANEWLSMDILLVWLDVL